jgi:hypothetical protein
MASPRYFYLIDHASDQRNSACSFPREQRDTSFDANYGWLPHLRGHSSPPTSTTCPTTSITTRPIHSNNSCVSLVSKCRRKNPVYRFRPFSDNLANPDPMTPEFFWPLFWSTGVNNISRLSLYHPAILFVWSWNRIPRSSQSTPANLPA